MKRILYIFIVLFLLVLPASSFAICGPAPTPGGDWVFPGGFCDNILLVCPTSEYTTIAEAMAAADAWDTIIVAEGTYNEAVVFAHDNITLRAFGSAENTIITQGAGTTISFATMSGCTVDGFTISLSAATATEDEVIFSNNDSATDFNTVKNCIIDVENKAGEDFGLYGINIDDGAFALLNNRITVTQTGDSAVYAIWNSAAHPFEFINNTLFLDQDSTGAYMTAAVAHAAGAGGILYCIENQITTDSEHTGASIGYSVYAHANLNYVNENIINAVGAAGVMYGLYTGTGDTAYYNSNFINVTTTDSDGQWANFGDGTSYANGNTIIGDGVMGTGGTIYTGINQVNDDSADSDGNFGIGTVSPAGVTHIVLEAGKPMLIGGDTIATLTGVTISNANPSVLTKDATIDDGLAVGDAVVVNSGTNATVGTYIVASIVANTSVTLDRQAATGACTDGNVTYVNDAIVIEAASGSGKPRIVLPLQNDAATPTLAFGDGDSGFYEETDNRIAFATAGIAAFRIRYYEFESNNNNGAYLRLDDSPSSTYPTFATKGDPNTGMGPAAADQLSLIAGGVEGIRITEDTTILVDINGSIRIKEQADAYADAAGYGQIWVHDTTPNELWFTDDAGTDTQISSHPLDAPSELYANGPGLDWIGKRVQRYLGIIFWQTLDGTITEETFAAYNLRRKDEPGHTDLVKQDWEVWEATCKAQWEREYIEKNTTEEIVSKDQAFEMVEVDERVLYEVADPKTGKIKKQGKQIGEKSMGFELVGDEVKEKVEPVWETKKVSKAQIKEDVRFDETNGKFYKKVVPTQAMAKAAAVEGFEFAPPAWMAEKLKAK